MLGATTDAVAVATVVIVITGVGATHAAVEEATAVTLILITGATTEALAVAAGGSSESFIISVGPETLAVAVAIAVT